MRGGKIDKDPLDNLWKITSDESGYDEINQYRTLEVGLLNRFARSSYYLDSSKFLERENALLIHNYRLLCKAAKKQPEDILLEEARGHKDAIITIISLRRAMNDIHPESSKTKTHLDRIEYWEAILLKITALFDSLEKEKTAKKQKEKDEKDRFEQRVKEKVERGIQRTEKRARLDIVWEELAKLPLADIEDRMGLSQGIIAKIEGAVTLLQVENERIVLSKPFPMDDEMRELNDKQITQHKAELEIRKRYYDSLKVEFARVKPLSLEKDALERELKDVLRKEEELAKRIAAEEKAAEAAKKVDEDTVEKEKEEREEVKNEV